MYVRLWAGSAVWCNWCKGAAAGGSCPDDDHTEPPGSSRPLCKFASQTRNLLVDVSWKASRSGQIGATWVLCISSSMFRVEVCPLRLCQKPAVTSVKGQQGGVLFSDQQHR